MESSTETNTTTTTNSSTLVGSNSPNSSSNSSPPSMPSPRPSPSLSPGPPIVISPCAACKILRRRCADKCVLAPYFPPTDPAKFTIAHRVFGASNIIKFLQELPESQRADAVSSMVYEASARIRDPVYGCAGAICHLQKQVGELQAQLAKAQAEVANMQCQQANLVALICMEITQPQHNNNNNNSTIGNDYYHDSSTLVHHHQQESSFDGSSLVNGNVMITNPTTPMITNSLEDNINLGQLWELWT